MMSKNILGRKVMLMIALSAAIPVMSLALLSWFSRRPDNLGVHDGRLADCPATSNCAGSTCTRDDCRMRPLTFQGSPQSAREKLIGIVQALPRTVIVSADDCYIHAECKSALFRFVDDVEFLIEPEQGTIQFRSASRVGKSDLGVNRRRMETIQTAWEKSAD